MAHCSSLFRHSRLTLSMILYYKLNSQETIVHVIIFLPGGRGDSSIRMTGVLVGNFVKNPLKVPPLLLGEAILKHQIN